MLIFWPPGPEPLRKRSVRSVSGTLVRGRLVRFVVRLLMRVDDRWGSGVCEVDVDVGVDVEVSVELGLIVKRDEEEDLTFEVNVERKREHRSDCEFVWDKHLRDRVSAGAVKMLGTGIWLATCWRSFEVVEHRKRCIEYQEMVA